MVPLWIIYVMVIQFHWTLSLTGNNVCEIQETYKINVTEFVPKNLTFRHYRWCLNMPPRCSYYTRKEIIEEKIVEKEKQKTIELCCPGYVEENNACVLDCVECRNKFCINSKTNNNTCPQNGPSYQRCSYSGCHGNCTLFEASCRELCQCPLDRNGKRCSISCRDEKEDQQLSEIQTDLDPLINTTEPVDFSPNNSDEVTPSSSFSQSVTENVSYVETVSKKPVTTLPNQRGYLDNMSQLPVIIVYEGFDGNGSNNSTVPLAKKKKKTMIDEGGSNNNKKRVVSTSAEAEPMTLHVRDKKTKEEQGSVDGDGTPDHVDSEPVTVMQDTATAQRHSVDVPLMKAKAGNDMEVSGSGATNTTTSDEEENGGGLLQRNLSIVGIDKVVGGGGLPSLEIDSADNGDSRVLFYTLLALTVAFAGIGMTISAIVAAVFIIKFKYGRRNNARDSSACCKVHFTKTDNNNSCNVAVNADCTNVNNVFQGVASPDLLQHQGTLPRDLTFSPVPELVDFSLKFSSNVCEKYCSSENVYDEIPSCKEDPTFSSFYVNFNSSNNTCS